ncbi:cytochrome P450 [Whalleya microplaca]|nr:cytochrome P450 [Whalleya microplaca]
MTSTKDLSLAFTFIQGLLVVIFGAISVYAMTRCVYLLYFHPLSRYPGPKVAAASNIWYAYHWISGRYPWETEKVLRKYGDVVRIAPNELLFIRPQAFADIYTPHVKNHELFVKTEINDRGDKTGGIAFERDPVRHREVRKQLSPAFSSRSITAKEPVMHKYIDLFVERMKAIGAVSEGVDLAQWCNWVAMDISADMTYNREMNQVRDMKNSVYMNVLLGFNQFTTIEQVSFRFPFMKRFRKLFLPISAMTSIPKMIQISRAELHRRLCQKGSTQHPDFFEQIVPANGVPVSSWFYGTLMNLLAEPEICEKLTQEIRANFQSYNDIRPVDLKPLQYLNACIQESLRVFPSNNLGLPRISPGAEVDGTYTPKGVYCQTSMFAMWRSPYYFHDPLRFRPQRWLPKNHPLYESKFSEDCLEGSHPMGQGLRVCIGKEVAWRITRLFIAKVFWTFDLVKVPGRELDFEKDFITYGFWSKPVLRARFVSIVLIVRHYFGSMVSGAMGLRGTTTTGDSGCSCQGIDPGLCVWRQYHFHYLTAEAVCAKPHRHLLATYLRPCMLLAASTLLTTLPKT